MRLATVSDMRALESAILAEGALDEADLIERAGCAAARYAEVRFGALRGRRVGILCGKGHNAADGLIAARCLAAQGAQVEAYLVLPKQELALLTLDALRQAEEVGLTIAKGSSAEWLKAFRPNLVLDALVGLGARLPLQGPLAQAAADCVDWAGPVLAMDLPSGLDPDQGEPKGPCVRASATVTFIATKLGLVSALARRFVGDLHLETLGVPDGLIEAHSKARLFEEAEARAALPGRDRDTHKKKAEVLILAGSVQYPGAALLCARAAYRCGAGLIRLAVPAPLLSTITLGLPEAVLLPLAGDHAGLADLEALLHAAHSAKAVIIGPGLGQDAGTWELILALWQQLPQTAVFDADALQKGLWERTASGPRVLTPHEGELKRLLGPRALDGGRPAAARELALKSKAVALLKGPATLVASPDGSLSVNSLGGPELATAGSGDVLAGAIGALLAQGAACAEAAALGAWLHAWAGEQWARAHAQRGLLASDLADLLPRALAHCGA